MVNGIYGKVVAWCKAVGIGILSRQVEEPTLDALYNTITYFVQGFESQNP